ncbi:hypothetical protein GLOIN_2v1841876 [Rhizophagus clarus]|uniref:Uncharacterized protein n=1 Tax=Rhizophagus clarus TaxID=94130 RepID=A0A8H3MEI4_9GLOM|nr:hypothetical protein GLOIN_2v1841876 [Rhizophagus clarus]
MDKFIILTALSHKVKSNAFLELFQKYKKLYKITTIFIKYFFYLKIFTLENHYVFNYGLSITFGTSLAILPYYASTAIPSTICTFTILYVPMICKFEYQLYKHFYKDSLLRPTYQSFSAFTTLVTGSMLLPLLVLVGDLLFMFTVVIASIGAVVMTIYGGLECGIEFCNRVAMTVPETYWEMIFPPENPEEKNIDY